MGGFLTDSIKATTKSNDASLSNSPKDSEQLSNDASPVTSRTNDVDSIRQRAAAVLEEAVTSGTMENASVAPSLLMMKNGEGIDLIRQKAIMALGNAASNGTLDKLMTRDDK